MNKLFICLLLVELTLHGAAQVKEINSPAAPKSGQPNLTVAPNGQVYLSWIERAADGKAALRFAGLQGEQWSSTKTIAEGPNWFVNWADFPSLAIMRDGSMAAHWLEKSAPGTYDYDVKIVRSFDAGKTWSKPFIPHRDGVQAEHGFVSLLPAKDGSLAAVWLDGREMKGHESDHSHGQGAMTLRYVNIKKDGAYTDEALLDARVCECCQTSAALTEQGPVVVYRDRSDSEVRDISIVRWVNGKWTQPKTIFADEWQINACPVNGPSIAARKNEVAVAWYTQSRNQPQVKLMFSQDGGNSFGKPVVIDEGNPMGRVETILLPDGSAMVCWLEKTNAGGAILARRVWPDGKRETAFNISATGTARSNGFPQMVFANNELVFAWTADRVLTARMALK